MPLLLWTVHNGPGHGSSPGPIEASGSGYTNGTIVSCAGWTRLQL